jgi:hypothetical protein
MPLNWETSRDDLTIILKIAERYMTYPDSLQIPKEFQRNKMTLIMDVEAVHNNGCPLRLQELLDADDFNFFHDMLGIQRYR